MLRPLALLPLCLLLGCESALTADRFQQQAERVYAEANPGFGVGRREHDKSIMFRGDQVYVLKTGPLFQEYVASKKSASAWFDAYKEKLVQEVKARKKTLDQAKEELIPILKSGAWVRVQDAGAIGPREIQDQIRPWRKQVTDDVFVLLGVPEQLLGYRYANIAEVASSSTAAEVWMSRAIQNLVAKVGTATGGATLDKPDGKPMVFDLPNEDGIAGLILDPGFRQKMLRKFDAVSLGAAIPNRDVLIVFEAEDFVTIKPIRARTHQLHDERNHPGFRGLLRFDADKITVLEPAHPEVKEKEKKE
ncbi:MAG: hypothetical protein U1E65_23910 [Myxococcota bacterium]